MKKLIFYFIILAAATWLGIVMQRNPGYVLIAYQQWTFESTIWFSLFALIVIFIILSIVIKFIRGTFHLSGRIKEWSHKKRLAKSLLSTKEGVVSFLLGQWRTAEKQLKNGVKLNPAAFVNYLFAAFAAAFQKREKQSERYFNKLKYKANKDEKIAIKVAQAKLLLDQQHYTAALNILVQINKEDDLDNYPMVILLLQKVYTALHQWQPLYELLPKIKKTNILNPESIDALTIQTYQGLIQHTAEKNDFKALMNLWQTIPKDLQTNPELVYTSANYFIQFNNLAIAEQLIKKALKNNWSTKVIRLYGSTAAPNPAKQLSEAESWLKAHPHDPDLLFTLGKLAAKNRLWGKAKHYLDQSNRLSTQAQTYFELGKVSEQLGELHAALNYYRNGLQFSSDFK